MSGWLPRQLTARRLTGVGVVVVLVLGLATWIKASDGHKEVDLGSSILGGLVVGLAVIAAERHFTRTVQIQREDVRSLATTPGAQPAWDEPGRAEPEPTTPSIPGGHYTVEYDSRMRDRSRVDAIQARLRMHRDGEYVQFVTAVAPGRVEHQDTPADQFWWSFSRLAGQLAERALRDGVIPLDDPTMAYEVQPPVETAMRLARREGKTVAQGDVVHEFDVGGILDDLRRAKVNNLSVRVGFKSGEASGLWGVADVDDAGGHVTFLVPVTMGTTNRRKVGLDQIAWVEVTDVGF